MPELPNHKREIFARFLADDHSQSESYELAGYRPSTANASTLANVPEVKARVAELKEEKMQREVELQARLQALGHESPEEALAAVEEVITWTCDKVRTELFKNARLAQSQNEFNAANKSLELIGKSLGMWENDKAEKNNGKDKPQVSIAFISEATQRLEDASRGEPSQALSPLAPRVPSPR